MIKVIALNQMNDNGVPQTLLELPGHTEKYSGRIPDGLEAIDVLITEDGISASGGKLYSNKLFGRDSAVSMLFLINSLKVSAENSTVDELHRIIERCIRSLVRFQGRKGPTDGGIWLESLEEPGKIHHEVTMGEEASFINYGSVDATPLFVKLICEYTNLLSKRSKRESKNFLDSKTWNFRGQSVSIAESANSAIAWVKGAIEKSNLGFLEYSRKNEQEMGTINQAWKDSRTSYIHANGELANTMQPIASVEVQALAYDALLEIADLYEIYLGSALSKQKAEAWRLAAEELRGRIFNRFWLDDEQRFIQAIDRDPLTSELRHVTVPSSNELHLLNSRLFDTCSDNEKRIYITSLVKQAVSTEFLTEIGIRCRASSAHGLIDYVDYHGSWMVWPWESHWIASGFKKQGLCALAEEIDNRVLNAINISGGHKEFYIADPQSGKAYYNFVTSEKAKTEDKVSVTIKSTNVPETPQAWTAAAGIDIKHVINPKKANKSPKLWANNLEKLLLKGIKHQPIITNSKKLMQLLEETPIIVIDIRGGCEAEKSYERLAAKKLKERTSTMDSDLVVALAT